MSVVNSDVQESLSKWEKWCVDDEAVNSLVQIHRILCANNNKMHVALSTISPAINLYHLRWPTYFIKNLLLKYIIYVSILKIIIPNEWKIFHQTVGHGSTRWKMSIWTCVPNSCILELWPFWILGHLVTVACVAHFLLFSDCLQMYCDMTYESWNSRAGVDVHC
jgi:hypothetical protein